MRVSAPTLAPIGPCLVPNRRHAESLCTGGRRDAGLGGLAEAVAGMFERVILLLATAILPCMVAVVVAATWWVTELLLVRR